MYFIDLETKSDGDLKSGGVYRYAETAKILLFSYAHDDGPVICVDVTRGESLPINILLSPTEIKVAHNANFERTILAAVLKQPMPPEQWLCTAAWAAYAGLPRSLDKAAHEARIGSKLEGGAKLIRKFCVDKKPCEGEDWETFKAYNIRDVEIERELFKWLQKYPMPEWDLWYIDQKINDKGFLVDVPLVTAAIKLLTKHSGVLMDEAKNISGILNPNSVAQLKKYLNHTGSLDKKAVMEKLKTATGTEKRILEIRQILGQSAVKKYQALANAVCKDNRVRGTMLFYGAHTGRWSGRLFQPQNLPRVKPVDPVFGRALVKAEDVDSINLYFSDVTSLLSTLIRTTIIAPPGGYLWIDDYSAIEARVCAWLAGETWILDCFRMGQPYYETTASKLYHIPVTNITKEQRQKGKTCALALQYQGGVGALQAMGAEMPEDEMWQLIDAWRNSCPAIVQYWYKLNEAAITCVRTKKPYVVGTVTFTYDGTDMFVLLPVGRKLIYRYAAECESLKTGAPAIDYDCEDKGHIVRKQLYGGLLTENIVQAVARDILADHLKFCQDSCVLHVHDEVILENVVIPLKQPSWATDLPLEIKGFKNTFYTKE